MHVKVAIKLIYRACRDMANLTSPPYVPLVLLCYSSIFPQVFQQMAYIILYKDPNSIIIITHITNPNPNPETHSPMYVMRFISDSGSISSAPQPYLFSLITCPIAIVVFAFKLSNSRLLV